MRTKRYRYTEWVRFNRNLWTPVWDMLYGTELYDHQADPEENHNLAYEEAGLVNYLRPKLRAGWR